MEFPPFILGQKSPRGIGLISIFIKILDVVGVNVLIEIII